MAGSRPCDNIERRQDAANRERAAADFECTDATTASTWVDDTKAKMKFSRFDHSQFGTRSQIGPRLGVNLGERGLVSFSSKFQKKMSLENDFLPSDLEDQIEAFVDHYNHRRYHESINNVAPADVYFGCDKAILKQRERIKRKTLEVRSAPLASPPASRIIKLTR